MGGYSRECHCVSFFSFFFGSLCFVFFLDVAFSMIIYGEEISACDYDLWT